MATSMSLILDFLEFNLPNIPQYINPCGKPKAFELIPTWWHNPNNNESYLTKSILNKDDNFIESEAKKIIWSDNWTFTNIE